MKLQMHNGSTMAVQLGSLLKEMISTLPMVGCLIMKVGGLIKLVRRGQ